jgi:uncharacterized OsmC-like protein
MGDVVYVSKSRIERKQGPLRIAHLPGEAQPVIFSVHGAIAEHYKVDPAKLKESHSSTIDYVISATAGWMMGTFGGALEARQIDASNGKLTADVTGEVETEDNVLVIRRIHVAMRLVAPQDVKETVERVHGMYAMRCPLYRTFHKTLQLTSSFELVAPGAQSWRTSWSRMECSIYLRLRAPKSLCRREDSDDFFFPNVHLFWPFSATFSDNLVTIHQANQKRIWVSRAQL